MRNGALVDVMDIFALAAVTSCADIQLIFAVLELDIEIKTTAHTRLVMIAIPRKPCHRIRIQIHCPSRLILHIIQLQLIAACYLYMRQILSKTFIFACRLSGKIRRAVHQNAIATGVTPHRAQYHKE